MPENQQFNPRDLRHSKYRQKMYVTAESITAIGGKGGRKVYVSILPHSSNQMRTKTFSR